MAIGYTPVINAAVLSVYRHVTNIAMLALVAVHAVVAVAVVGLAIISALAVKASGWKGTLGNGAPRLFGRGGEEYTGEIVSGWGE